METILFRTLAFVLFFGVQVLGYPPQERLMPDGAPVPEDAIEREDSVASASEVDEEYDDTDDSDMYMEPDAAGAAETETYHPEQPAEKSERETAVELPERKDEHGPASAKTVEVKDQVAKTTADSTATENPEERSLETESQNFFPSFAELFSNHRLPFTEQQQQQRYRPNRFLGYFQRDRAAYQGASTTPKEVQHPLLGSGNFGVIRGGTYYPEDKENDEYTAGEGVYNPFFPGGSAARGRAAYYRNPKPQPVRGGDFFSNFRDFADITAPPKSSFSHLSVVYANKNGSATGRITEPRNIIETLRMLEEEEEEEEGRLGVETTTVAVEAPPKKLSKGKRKLITMKRYDEDKARRYRMSIEPLLALS